MKFIPKLFIDVEEKLKICCSQVFAPLARLLGLYSVKEELEELAFGYSMPDEYTAIRLHLDQLAREQGPTVQWVSYRIAVRATPKPLNSLQRR